jgi:hypothetical protein
MVLISIRPFALRKLFLVIVAFLCFSAFCFADPVLMVRRYSNHPVRLGAPTSAPESQDARLAKSQVEVWEPVGFTWEKIKLDFTDRETSSVISTTPLSIFGKPACAMHPLGPDAGLAVAPILSAREEI